MGAILPLIFGILSKIPGQIGEYYAKKQELEKLKVETQSKIEHEKQQFAAEMAKADAERATESLKATGQYFKYAVFWMLSSPFISCLLNYPEYAEMVFKNLNALPEWYLIIYTGIIGVIYGIPVPGSVMGNIWQGIKDSREKTREFKLQKLNAKAALDTMRKLVFTKGMTQQQVDAIKASWKAGGVQIDD
jgi:hypothetical protein